MQSIYLAGGCFWCTEAIFLKIKGITKVTSGYIGGNTINPSYADICKGNSGHAEAIKCEYNENVITLEEILNVFFRIHDATQLNRQGNDIGTQYRSAIFIDDNKKEKIVNDFIKKLESMYSYKIVTEVSNKNNFYKAEEYHQNYFNKNPNSAYCKIIIIPKLELIKKNIFVK